MAQETQTPENGKAQFVAPAGSAGAQSFQSAPTASGIPLPTIAQKKNNLKPLIFVIAFLALSAGGYFFYRIQFLSPEVLLVKSLQAISNAKNITSQGEVIIDSSDNYAVYSSLSEANLVQKGIFAQDDKINLQVEFTYASDSTDEANPKRQVAINLFFSNSKDTTKKVEHTTEVKTLNNKVYSTIKGLPALDDPSVSKEWNKWAVEDNKATGSSKTQTSSLPLESTANFDNVLGNYLNAINLLKTRKLIKAFGVLTSQPSETINGISFYRIKIHTDKEMMRKFFAKLKAENKLGDVSEEKINDITNNLESLDLEFWIAKANSFPQKINLVSKTKDVNNQISQVSVNINSLSSEARVAIDVPGNVINAREFSQYLQQLAVMSDEFNLQGFNLMNAGDNAGAKPYLEKAIKYNPNHFRAYNSLGLIYAGNKNYDKAIQLYRTALQINPDHDKAAINLIAALYGKGDCAATIDEAKKFYSIYPQSGFLREAHWWAGDGYRCLQKNDLAIEELNIVLQMDSASLSNAATYQEIGANYYQLKQYDKSVFNYQQSINWLLKNPKPDKTIIAVTYQDLASAYAALKQFDKADGAMANALRYNPQLKKDPVYQSQLRSIDMLRNWEF